MKLTDAQVDHMTNRFLAWKLPADFRPDGGVEFDPDAAKRLDPRNVRHEPYGTNLLDHAQAREMVLAMISGLPDGE